MAHLHDLVKEDSTVISSMTGVDYNHYCDHEDDDAMTSLFIFDPQEFAQPPSNTISIFGSDNKEKAGCGQDVVITATGCYYVHKNVAE